MKTRVIRLEFQASALGKRGKDLLFQDAFENEVVSDASEKLIDVDFASTAQTRRAIWHFPPSE